MWWVEDSGGDGIPVVLLHPGWGDSAGWEPVLEALPDDVRTIRYDVRGYGRSPAPAGEFNPLWDLLEILDRRGVDEAVVVGHSGGAATALSLAVTEPDRVAGLVLIAPGVGDYPWDFDDPYFKSFAELYDARDEEGLVELGQRTWARAGSCPATDAQLRSGVRGMLTQNGMAASEPPTYARLGELDMPVPLLIGDLDHPLVLRCAGDVAVRIPDCQVLTLPGVDHLLPLRAPDVVADVITEVLEEVG